MTDQSTPSLQFDKAEFQAPQRAACALCKTEIVSDYYAVNGHTICESCRQRIGTGRKPVTPANFARAFTFGVGAAIVGAVIWGAVRSASGSDWGLIAVVVGLLVGNAVARGSQKTGGWVFQALAIALTYVTIALSWVPEISKELGGKLDGQVGHGAIRWIVVAGIAFSAPVIASTSSIFGFLINAFAIYEAWKTNKRAKLLISGPFQLQVPSPAPAPVPEPVPEPEPVAESEVVPGE